MEQLNKFFEECESGNNQPLLELIQREGPDWRVGDQSPLEVSCICGNERCLAVLLSAGCNPNTKSSGTIQLKRLLIFQEA